LIEAAAVTGVNPVTSIAFRGLFDIGSELLRNLPPMLGGSRHRSE
jgi:hypothetical protein